MANGIDIKIGTLFDKSGITEANKSLARLAQDVKAVNGNLRESASAAGLDMAREADKACLAQVGAYANVEKKVVEVATEITNVGEVAKVAGATASKSFVSLEMILGLCRGSTEQVAKAMGGLIGKISLIGKFGLGPISAFIAALVSVFTLLMAIKDLVVVAFNLNQVSDEVKEVHSKFLNLNKAAENFKTKMDESREIAERQVKAFEDEANALAKVTKAQNELNRQMELAVAKTDEERQNINAKWDSANAGVEEEAAQSIRDNRARSLRDEETRIRQEIKNARRLQKEYRSLFGTELVVEASDKALDQQDIIDDAQKRLAENRRQQGLLDKENEAAEAMIEARKLKEENAAKLVAAKKAEAEKKAAEEAAEKQAKLDADNAKKIEAERVKAAEAEKKAREKAEAELHAQRIANIKSEIDAKETAANGLQSVAQQAQTEFDRAFAMYRDPEQAAAQIAEERDYAADYKQLQKDASRYGGKWRIDELSRLMAAGDTQGQAATLEEWRKSSRFTPEVEAMVRAAAADKTRTTAEDELRKLNKTTEETKEMLENLLTMKG